MFKQDFYESCFTGKLTMQVTNIFVLQAISADVPARLATHFFHFNPNNLLCFKFNVKISLFFLMPMYRQISQLLKSARIAKFCISRKENLLYSCTWSMKNLRISIFKDSEKMQKQEMMAFKIFRSSSGSLTRD